MIFPTFPPQTAFRARQKSLLQMLEVESKQDREPVKRGKKNDHCNEIESPGGKKICRRNLLNLLPFENTTNVTWEYIEIETTAENESETQRNFTRQRPTIS
ncbi:hypothetical protein RUM43_013019 [Polyplax serrata]|uniref:Uncharacterized protein n=1 Tax=Polyplax serrata TaxID=468196 RepID=A0AAN8NJP6_POLSC